jgi:hypothetical protein
LTVLLSEPSIRNVKQPQMDGAAMTIDNDQIGSLDQSKRDFPEAV